MPEYPRAGGLGVQIEEVTFGSDRFTQELDAYLKGEATRTIRRESYTVVNGAMSRGIKKAAVLAKNGTERKYPNARQRDPRRHPNPGLPHLADSWDYQLASEGGVKLFNTHPKAAMLIMGITKPSVIAPVNRFSSKLGKAVLMYPRRPAPAHLWANSIYIGAKTVTRPIPSSQRRINEHESIGYRAIRNAFRATRRG